MSAIEKELTGSEIAARVIKQLADRFDYRYAEWQTLDEKHYIYFAQEVTDADDGDRSGFVKIGVADNLTKRLTGLQGGNPRKLRMRYAFGPCVKWGTKRNRPGSAFWVESLFHAMFHKWRQSGEWFAAEGLRPIFEGIEELDGKLVKNIKVQELEKVIHSAILAGHFD